MLDAARSAGIDIPTLCHLPGRPARPACSLCMVKVEGTSRLVPACATPAVDGMVVWNLCDEVTAARRTAIELLLSDHLGDCIGPCQSVCPAHMDIPDMIRHIAAGQFREALITVKESIALPAVLGRICPELCEKGCRRTAHDGPVSVCQLKRFVADYDLATGDPYVPPCAPPSGRRVAIVGTGPAGLAAAYYLLQQGHACVLFDDHEEPGGMLRYGVPEEDLDRAALDGEIAIIRRMGAQFRCSTRVGTPPSERGAIGVSLPALQQEFDAVLIAAGDIQKSPACLPELARSAQGVRTDRSSMSTNLPAVFAAGSAIIPSRHAVRAVADGRAAAQAIGICLGGVTAIGERKEFSVHIGKMSAEEIAPLIERVSPEGRAGQQGGRQTGLTVEEAIAEAKRCLQCDCRKAEGCKLRACAMAYEANPLRFKAERRLPMLDESHPLLLFEPGKCIACGICVRLAAEAGEELGISFAGRGFSMRISAPLGRSIADGLRHAARACAESCPTAALTLREGAP